MADDQIQDSLIREVDDELREEQMAKLWKRYGSTIIGVAILIVAIVAGYQGWTTYTTSQRHGESEQFYNASGLYDSGDLAGALSAMQALSHDGNTGYGLLAQFQQAAILKRQGDAQGAAVTYRTISTDTSAGMAMQGLATVLGVMVEMDAGISDKADLKSRLGAISGPSQPWRHSARELLALLALEDGNIDEARRLYSELVVDLSTPKNLRTRAQKLLVQLGA